MSQLLQRVKRELLDVIDSINQDKIHHDGDDFHELLRDIDIALAQPWPDLTEQQREAYQKGHNDGVAHHKQAVKAAQPEQGPVVGTKTWFEDGKVVTQHLTAKDIYKEPEQEPVVCCGDYATCMKPCTPRGRWLAEQEPVAQLECTYGYNQCEALSIAKKKRPWVGLTDAESQLIYDMGRTPSGMMEMVESKLKEKNTWPTK